MIDQTTVTGMNIVASFGSIDLGAAEIQRHFGLDDDSAMELAQECASHIIASAPPQLALSFQHACSYHILRGICVTGMKNGDIGTVIEAQRSIHKMLEQFS